ncbi:MAG: ABC transporter permease [Dehalococcoidia bacterium]
MKPLLDLYRAQFATTLATQLQYRVSAAIWLIAAVLQPIVYLVVWSAVARSNGGSVGDYTRAAFAGYFIVTMLVNYVTDTWVMYVFDMRIRDGSFSPMLLRPVHPIHADIAENVTHKLIQSSVMLPAAVGLAFAFRPALHPQPWAVLAFLPALVLAWALCFLTGWTLALASFWTTRVSAINQMYYVVELFLSGRVAPLTLFPSPIQALATLLPFRWIVAFPVELLLGRLSRAEALSGFAAQSLWLALDLALLRLIWRAGLRRYSAVGA